MEEKEAPEIEAYDDVEIWRCRQLGGPVTFKYCRVMNGGLPCTRVFECWGARIDLAAFIAANYSREEIEKAFAGPSKDRLSRIIETLENVKKREGE